MAFEFFITFKKLTYFFKPLCVLKFNKMLGLELAGFEVYIIDMGPLCDANQLK